MNVINFKDALNPVLKLTQKRQPIQINFQNHSPLDVPGQEGKDYREEDLEAMGVLEGV